MRDYIGLICSHSVRLRPIGQSDYPEKLGGMQEIQTITPK